MKYHQGLGAKHFKMDHSSHPPTKNLQSFKDNMMMDESYQSYLEQPSMSDPATQFPKQSEKVEANPSFKMAERRHIEEHMNPMTLADQLLHQKGQLSGSALNMQGKTNQNEIIKNNNEEKNKLPTIALQSLEEERNKPKPHHIENRNEISIRDEPSMNDPMTQIPRDSTKIDVNPAFKFTEKIHNFKLEMENQPKNNVYDPKADSHAENTEAQQLHGDKKPIIPEKDLKEELQLKKMGDANLKEINKQSFRDDDYEIREQNSIHGPSAHIQYDFRPHASTQMQDGLNNANLKSVNKVAEMQTSKDNIGKKDPKRELTIEELLKLEFGNDDESRSDSNRSDSVKLAGQKKANLKPHQKLDHQKIEELEKEESENEEAKLPDSKGKNLSNNAGNKAIEANAKTNGHFRASKAEELIKSEPHKPENLTQGGSVKSDLKQELPKLNTQDAIDIRDAREKMSALRSIFEGLWNLYEFNQTDSNDFRQTASYYYKELFKTHKPFEQLIEKFLTYPTPENEQVLAEMLGLNDKVSFLQEDLTKYRNEKVKYEEHRQYALLVLRPQTAREHNEEGKTPVQHDLENAVLNDNKKQVIKKPSDIKDKRQSENEFRSLDEIDDEKSFRALHIPDTQNIKLRENLFQSKTTEHKHPHSRQDKIENHPENQNIIPSIKGEDQKKNNMVDLNNEYIDQQVSISDNLVKQIPRESYKIDANPSFKLNLMVDEDKRIAEKGDIVLDHAAKIELEQQQHQNHDHHAEFLNKLQEPIQLGSVTEQPIQNVSLKDAQTHQEAINKNNFKSEGLKLESIKQTPIIDPVRLQEPSFIETEREDGRIKREPSPNLKLGIANAQDVNLDHSKKFNPNEVINPDKLPHLASEKNETIKNSQQSPGNKNLPPPIKNHQGLGANHFKIDHSNYPPTKNPQNFRDNSIMMMDDSYQEQPSMSNPVTQFPRQSENMDASPSFKMAERKRIEEHANPITLADQVLRGITSETNKAGPMKQELQSRAKGEQVEKPSGTDKNLDINNSFKIESHTNNSKKGFKTQPSDHLSVKDTEGNKVIADANYQNKNDISIREEPSMSDPITQMPRDSQKFDPKPAFKFNEILHKEKLDAIGNSPLSVQHLEAQKGVINQKQDKIGGYNILAVQDKQKSSDLPKSSKKRITGPKKISGSGGFGNKTQVSNPGTQKKFSMTKRPLKKFQSVGSNKFVENANKTSFSNVDSNKKDIPGNLKGNLKGSQDTQRSQEDSPVKVNSADLYQKARSLFSPETSVRNSVLAENRMSEEKTNPVHKKSKPQFGSALNLKQTARDDPVTHKAEVEVVDAQTKFLRDIELAESKIVKKKGPTFESNQLQTKNLEKLGESYIENREQDNNYSIRDQPSMSDPITQIPRESYKIDAQPSFKMHERFNENKASTARLQDRSSPIYQKELTREDEEEVKVYERPKYEDDYFNNKIIGPNLQSGNPPNKIGPLQNMKPVDGKSSSNEEVNDKISLKQEYPKLFEDETDNRGRFAVQKLPYYNIGMGPDMSKQHAQGQLHPNQKPMLEDDAVMEESKSHISIDQEVDTDLKVPATDGQLHHREEAGKDGRIKEPENNLKPIQPQQSNKQPMKNFKIDATSQPPKKNEHSVSNIIDDDYDNEKSFKDQPSMNDPMTQLPRESYKKDASPGFNFGEKHDLKLHIDAFSDNVIDLNQQQIQKPQEGVNMETIHKIEKDVKKDDEVRIEPEKQGHSIPNTNLKTVKEETKPTNFEGKGANHLKLDFITHLQPKNNKSFDSDGNNEMKDDYSVEHTNLQLPNNVIINSTKPLDKQQADREAVEKKDSQKDEARNQKGEALKKSESKPGLTDSPIKKEELMTPKQGTAGGAGLIQSDSQKIKPESVEIKDAKRSIKTLNNIFEGLWNLYKHNQTDSNDLQSTLSYYYQELLNAQKPLGKLMEKFLSNPTTENEEVLAEMFQLNDKVSSLQENLVKFKNKQTKYRSHRLIALKLLKIQNEEEGDKADRKASDRRASSGKVTTQDKRESKNTLDKEALLINEGDKKIIKKQSVETKDKRQSENENELGSLDEIDDEKSFRILHVPDTQNLKLGENVFQTKMPGPHHPQGVGSDVVIGDQNKKEYYQEKQEIVLLNKKEKSNRLDNNDHQIREGGIIEDHPEHQISMGDDQVKQLPRESNKIDANPSLKINQQQQPHFLTESDKRRTGKEDVVLLDQPLDRKEQVPDIHLIENQIDRNVHDSTQQKKDMPTEEKTKPNIILIDEKPSSGEKKLVTNNFQEKISSTMNTKKGVTQLKPEPSRHPPSKDAQSVHSDILDNESQEEGKKKDILNQMQQPDSHLLNRKDPSQPITMRNEKTADDQKKQDSTIEVKSEKDQDKITKDEPDKTNFSKGQKGEKRTESNNEQPQLGGGSKLDTKAELMKDGFKTEGTLDKRETLSKDITAKGQQAQVQQDESAETKEAKAIITTIKTILEGLFHLYEFNEVESEDFRQTFSFYFDELLNTRKTFDQLIIKLVSHSTPDTESVLPEMFELREKISRLETVRKENEAKKSTFTAHRLKALNILEFRELKSHADQQVREKEKEEGKTQLQTPNSVIGDKNRLDKSQKTPMDNVQTLETKQKRLLEDKNDSLEEIVDEMPGSRPAGIRNITVDGNVFQKKQDIARPDKTAKDKESHAVINKYDEEIEDHFSVNDPVTKIPREPYKIEAAPSFKLHQLKDSQIQLKHKEDRPATISSEISAKREFDKVEALNDRQTDLRPKNVVINEDGPQFKEFGSQEELGFEVTKGNKKIAQLKKRAGQDDQTDSPQESKYQPSQMSQIPKTISGINKFSLQRNVEDSQPARIESITRPETSAFEKKKEIFSRPEIWKEPSELKTRTPEENYIIDLRIQRARNVIPIFAPVRASELQDDTDSNQQEVQKVLDKKPDSEERNQSRKTVLKQKPKTIFAQRQIIHASDALDDVDDPNDGKEELLFFPEIRNEARQEIIEIPIEFIEGPSQKQKEFIYNKEIDQFNMTKHANEEISLVPKRRTHEQEKNKMAQSVNQRGGQLNEKSEDFQPVFSKSNSQSARLSPNKFSTELKGMSESIQLSRERPVGLRLSPSVYKQTLESKRSPSKSEVPHSFFADPSVLAKLEEELHLLRNQNETIRNSTTQEESLQSAVVNLQRKLDEYQDEFKTLRDRNLMLQSQPKEQIGESLRLKLENMEAENSKLKRTLSHISKEKPTRTEPKSLQEIAKELSEENERLASLMDSLNKGHQSLSHKLSLLDEFPTSLTQSEGNKATRTEEKTSNNTRSSKTEINPDKTRLTNHKDMQYGSPESKGFNNSLSGYGKNDFDWFVNIGSPINHDLFWNESVNHSNLYNQSKLSSSGYKISNKQELSHTKTQNVQEMRAETPEPLMKVKPITPMTIKIEPIKNTVKKPSHQEIEENFDFVGFQQNFLNSSLDNHKCHTCEICTARKEEHLSIQGKNISQFNSTVGGFSNNTPIEAHWKNRDGYSTNYQGLNDYDVLRSKNFLNFQSGEKISLENDWTKLYKTSVHRSLNYADLTTESEAKSSLEDLRGFFRKAAFSNSLHNFKMGCVKNKSLIYENEFLQVESSSSIKQAQLQIILNFINKSHEPISNFTTKLSEYTNLAATLKPEKIESLVVREKQTKQIVSISLKNLPISHLQLHCEGFRGVQTIRFNFLLPVMVNKFMEFKYTDSEEFLNYWKKYSHNVTKSGPIQVDSTIIRNAQDFKKYFANLIDLSLVNDAGWLESSRSAIVAGIFDLKDVNSQYAVKISYLHSQEVVFEIATSIKNAQYTKFIIESLAFLFGKKDT